MRYLKSFLVACAALFAAACTPEEQPPVETPKEPAAPVIVSAQLKGVNGEAEIIAGNPVKFTASVTVENSELLDYTLEIKKDGAVIGSASGELTGTSATIEKELTLDVSPATLDAPFFPVVTLKVTNKDEMYAEKTLEEADNVKITTMELLDALWLVDNLGAAYQMSATDEKGKYRTTASLEVLGTSFQIVSKVTEEGAVDPSGENYGTFNTPEAGEEGLYWIGYNVFTGELSKCLNLTHTLDYTKMANDGDYKVYWNATLVQDCRVVFLNYPEGIQLQADRWADVEGNTARYTGHTNEHWEIYHNPDANWLVLKEQYSTTPSLWVTGENAGLPMSPYVGEFAFNWFGADVTNTNWWRSWDRATAVMKGENEWEILLYFKANFGIKLYYGAASWGAECAWTSTTPETLVISEVVADPETGALDGNYGNAGPSFTEGLYTLKYNSATEEVSLEKYTGPTYGVAAGDKDPIAPEPEIPDVPEPAEAPLYLVDEAGNAWAMSLVSGTKFVTDETTYNVGNVLKFAEKYSDGVIDESGAVYGEFNLDAAYAVYGQKPHQICFDTATQKVTYKEIVDMSKLGNNGDGRLVRWVVTLPQDCEVIFQNFEKPISEMVNLVGFADIDNIAGTARYIGVSQNYELWYRVDQGWLDFSNNIADDKLFYIGKNCSFAQSPYTEYSCTEDLSKVTGNTLSWFKMSENIFKINVYLADNFGFYLYKDYLWEQCVDAWTSATPDILVPHETTYTFGTQNVNNAFTPGVYTLTYDRAANTVAMELLKADSQEPEPETPPTNLILKDNNNNQWNMSLVSGSHYVTDEETGTIGTSFQILHPSGKQYGEYELDYAYSLHGGKKPWKIGFDLEANKVIYRVGIWRGAEAADGDGAAIIEWITRLPQNAEVFFFGFDKPVSQIVNTGIFTNIDDVNASARYVGVSDAFETWYRPTEGWLVFNNNDALSIGNSNNHILIGRGASFPQSPYMDCPIVGDIFADKGAKTAKNIPLFRVGENLYKTDLYLSKDFEIQMYSNYGWVAAVTDWTSEDVEKKSENVTWMQAKDRSTFVEGVYTIEYDSASKIVTLTKK